MKKCRNFLGRIREAQGRTLHDVSEATGISVASINHFEHGKRPMPDHKLKKILQFLHADIDDIFASTESYPEPKSHTTCIRDGDSDNVAMRLTAVENGIMDCKNVCEKTNELLMTIQNTLLRILATGGGNADNGVGNSVEKRAG